MAAAERDRIAAAARLRRTGPRTFQRPPRTLSSTLCRGQYSGLQSDYFGAVLSPAPPQMKRDFIKPLVIMTPKSLLRAEFASSPAKEFTSGKFEEILGSPEVGPANKMKRVILCSGKIYYDLINYRAEKKIDNAAIIRMEQLYPLHETKLKSMIKAFPETIGIVWCQEEPENMGGWSFIEPRLRKLFEREIAYAGRDSSASPAVGSLVRHKREQACVVADAFKV